MKEIRKIQAIRKVNKALRTQNSFGTTHVHDLFLNNPILVYREKKGWRRSYKFLGIKGETVKALINNNLIRTFRFTFMRLFKTNNFSVK